MALGVTQDTSAIAALKEFYGVQDIETLVFRNSPTLGRIKKVRVGGKYVPLPMATYGSGAVTSDYTQVTNQAANSNLTLTMQVTPGRLFSSFVLDPEEFLASQGDRAAFISILALKAMLALDDLKKTLASCLFHSGFLDLGTVAAVDTSRLYVDVNPDVAMAISPQSQLLFAASTSSAYRDPNAVVVQSVATQPSGLVRITFTSAYVAGVAVADTIFIKGGRDLNLAPNAPVGLAQWLPTVGGRTGTTWTTYIATNFFGVNRSVAPDRLAGQFVQRNSGAGESYTAALLRAIKLVRRGGGLPDTIVVNDDDFATIVNDALANRTFYQDVNGANKGGKNAVTQGITQFQMNFSTSWINTVLDDPYCPKGTAYVLDSETLRLFGISNVTPVTDDLPASNEPGAPKAAGSPEPNTMFQFLTDDMYTTTPIALQSGPGIRYDYQLYGAFAVTAPAHNAVVLF